MQIHIKGIEDERLIRPLTNITNLFFEESSLSFTAREEDRFTVDFTIKTDDVISAEAVLTSLEESRQWTSFIEQEALPENELHKQIKEAVSKAYLQVLQEEEGIIQKWGILTGIRPTKLLHKKMREGGGIEEMHKFLQDQYFISPEKIQLMQKIVDTQLKAVPDLYSLGKEVSIYIGIPFCPTKCAYCTFPAYAINGRQGSVDSFLGGLHYEMKAMGKWLKENGIRITTVYFGGGTPTSITAEEMDMLYEEMYESFPDVKNIREITVEAGRPDTITPEKLEVLTKWNIDRISINPQSYIPQTLKAIGRHHTVEETIEKFKLAREMEMKNINMDLIIGLPGEGTKEFQYTLDETEKLMPESLTVHTLSFKRASEMTRNKQKYQVAGRTEAEEMMKMAENWTASHGYTPYYLYRQKNILGNLENVGYSMPGQESIYNIMIMEEMQTIIGIGCGAASKFIHPETGKITQFANPKDPKSYNDSFEKYTADKIRLLEETFSITNTLI
ncbi:coproporphyrinogen III oxidase [Peribacillus kribbensis]|uniref:coproporphyrinogen III oxidase n=1 Tax=Peribacillus kribbensis TaxID=356658 RepID=UPI00047D9813|nr:coproporphyrinogen III oxidase [Peribacillus kribbensis]